MNRGTKLCDSAPTRSTCRRCATGTLSSWTGALGLIFLVACSSLVDDDAVVTADGISGDGEDHCFDPVDKVLAENGHMWEVSSGRIECDHYQIHPGSCTKKWNSIWNKGTVSPYLVGQRSLKSAWVRAGSDAVIGIGKFFRENGFRPAYGSVEIAASSGVAFVGMTWQWLEPNPEPSGPRIMWRSLMCPNAASLTDLIDEHYNREWIDTFSPRPGGHALVPPCCGRVHCSQEAFAFGGDKHVGGCGETFALVWQPDPGGAKEPACVKLTFHPLNACDPAFHEALYACIIETPLEFAVCYNGATPASVGWPGVQQVELEPLPLGPGAP